MSAETKQPEAPTVGDVLMDQVYKPAFVKACADLGIGFKDESHLMTALESTAQLRMIEAQEAAQSDPIEKAAASLNVALTGKPESMLKSAAGTETPQVEQPGMDKATHDSLVAALAAAL